MGVAALAGTWNVQAARDKQEVARMTQKMKTVCVGRLLINLPEEAEIDLAQARIDSFDIDAFIETQEEFYSRLAAREAQLRSKPDRLGGSNNLEVVREVRTDAGLTGKIFMHNREVMEGTRARGLELERYRFEGVSLEALVHANGISFDVVATDDEPEALENLSSLVSKLVPNPENLIPTEPGYCIDKAYVRDPLTAEQRERVVLFARLPSRPDIGIELSLAAGVMPDQQGLLQRSDSAFQRDLAESGRVTRLRAAPRKIAGLEGDELIRRFVEHNDTVVYNLWWEVNGTRDNVLVPHVLLMMDTGVGEHGPVPSSLSEGAAIGLWDSIASSIRPRQTSVLRRVDVPHETPLGTFASAGDICPHSGWWLCSDGGHGTNVLGGQRQYIEKGARMPQALLLPPQTWWEKIRGLQPSYESRQPTAWKLEDKRSRKRIAPPVQLAAATQVAPVGTNATSSGAGSLRHAPVPLGSYASTGAPCPASGWWRSEEPHSLDGTRWFAEGSQLPPATFVVPPEVFGRSGGVPKAIRRRGTWQLVRHAEAERILAAQASQEDVRNTGNGSSVV
jgi:hypothetical protein